jgi:hypothetical protein
MLTTLPAFGSNLAGNYLCAGIPNSLRRLQYWQTHLLLLVRRLFGASKALGDDFLHS